MFDNNKKWFESISSHMKTAAGAVAGAVSNAASKVAAAASAATKPKNH